jgi:hypothetical protein
MASSNAFSPLAPARALMAQLQQVQVQQVLKQVTPAEIAERSPRQ